MRFDLLDEFSTVVPFGLGISRNRTCQHPTVPAEAPKDDTSASFDGRPDLHRKLLGALRQAMQSFLGHRAVARMSPPQASSPSSH